MRGKKNGSRRRLRRLSRRPPFRIRPRPTEGNSNRLNHASAEIRKGRKANNKNQNTVKSKGRKAVNQASGDTGYVPPFLQPPRIASQHMVLDYAFVKISSENITKNTFSFQSSKAHPSASGGYASHTLGSHSSWAPAFTPLPPLPSFIQGPSLSKVTSASTFSSPYSSPTSIVPEESLTSPKERETIPTPFIVLMAVGAAFLLLGAAIILRVLARPRRRERITPSLPFIDQDVGAGDDYGNQESPMFGGKERLTATEKNGPLWTWVQYTKPEALDMAEKGESHEPGNASSDDMTVNKCPLSAITEMEPSALTRAPTKSSYSSLRGKAGGDNSISALTDTPQATAFTGDGHRALQRLSRTRDLRRSHSYSDGRGATKRRDSLYRPDSAYEGADVSSPSAYYQPVSTPVIGFKPAGGTEGRARIQSAYFATGTYPRASSVPGTYSINTATEVNLAQVQAHSLRARKDASNDGEHDKELGLIYSEVRSPTPSYGVMSPQPTLYPEDSLSVAGSKRTKGTSQHYQQKRDSRLYSKLYIPDAGACKAPTKSLLEMEFDVSRMSLSDIAAPPAGDPRAGAGYVTEDHISRSRGDRPPRVPSPPPIPSLAQMALAHGNPEAYNNYRSPTYSIYGMYGERKSVVMTAH